MRTGLLILAACCLGATATPTLAQTRGTRTCHKWAEERARADDRQEMNRVPVLITKSWFLGYVAGRASTAKRDFLAGTDNESMFLWLDQYCTEHPQEDLARAGQALEAALAVAGKSGRR